MNKRTFDDFDDFADDYRSIHTQNVKLSGADSFYFAKMKVELLKQFEQNSSLKVLDIGCGDGSTEIFMQQIFPLWKIEGIDISEKSIAVAKKRGLANASFQSYNGSAIPFSDNNFDIVFIAGVLHHVDHSFHKKIVSEINRVLIKGGRVFLFEHNPLNPLTQHLVKTCVFDKDAKLLKSSYITKLFKSTGLQAADKNFIIFFPRKGILSKFIFLEKWFKSIPLGGQYFIRAIKN